MSLNRPLLNAVGLIVEKLYAQKHITLGYAQHIYHDQRCIFYFKSRISAAIMMSLPLYALAMPLRTPCHYVRHAITYAMPLRTPCHYVRHAITYAMPLRTPLCLPEIKDNGWSQSKTAVLGCSSRAPMYSRAPRCF